MKLKLAIILAIFSLKAIAGLENLSRTPGVTYSYIDNNGHVIPSHKLQDPDCKFLSDGKRGGVDGAKSIHRYSEEKNLRILFRFPIPVTIDKAAFIWLHAYSPKQWFDKAAIYAGDSIKTLTKIGSTVCPGGKARETHVEITFDKPVKSTLFLLDIKQEANPKHAMIIISEIMLFGAGNQLKTIESVMNRHLKVDISRHYPCNIFASGTEVRFPVKISGINNEKVLLKTTLTDYYNNIVDQNDVVLDPGADQANLQYKFLKNGYYRLNIDAKVVTREKHTIKGSAFTNFIIAPLTKRSAAEALRAGNHFGITGHHSNAESRFAPTQLGLSWNSFLLNWGPNNGKDPHHPDFSKARAVVKAYCSDIPANNFIQIKSTPIWCYDKKRFGAPARNWALKMPTNKSAFQKYIREQAKLIPENQKHIKIWNEPWDSYTPNDYATLCNWIGEAVKQVRPDIMIGPNLGPMAYMEKFLDHGGMEYMDMLFVHPYSADFTSTPESAGLRQRLRSWKKLLVKKTGSEYPIYVTEVGWPTPESGPCRNTEERQAYCIARTGLNLYAEDVKATTFFCNGSPEKIKNYREHYFGFFHRNNDPKPVLAAAATMNRMLEGSVFLGDLSLGPDIGAMLFRLPNKQYMLAIYSDGKTQKIFIRPYASKLKMVDVVGKESETQISENRLSLTVDNNPVYLIGVGKEMQEKVVSPMSISWSGRYQRQERTCHYSAGLPDAKFWSKQPKWKISSSKIPEKHLSAEWQAAWNKDKLFLNIMITDQQPGINFADGIHIWQGDCIELFISTNPDNPIPGFLKEYDHQILISPFSKSGKPVAVSADIHHQGLSMKNIETSYKIDKHSWSAFITIPFSSLNYKIAKEAKLSLDITIDDLCMDHRKDRLSISSNRRKDNHSNPAIWTILHLSGTPEDKPSK